MSLQSKEAVYVKSEPEWESEGPCGVSESAARLQGGWLTDNEVKNEQDWEIAADACGVSEAAAWVQAGCLIDHEVKDEQDWENEADACGVSEAAALEGLYRHHQVKDELVLGPELLQPPDAVFALESSLRQVKKETCCTQKNLVGKTCSVSLEHMFVDKDHQTCRVGFQTYKLRLCRQGLQPLVQGDIEANAMKIMRRNTSRAASPAEHTYARLGPAPAPREDTSGQMRHKDQRIRHKTNKSQLCVRDGLKKRNADTAEEQAASVSSQVYSETDAAGEMRAVKPTAIKTKVTSNDNCSSHFTCDSCSRAFETKLMLLEHFKRTRHSENCSLLGHERIHTGEKPYKCGQCSYVSAHKSNLLTHERIHTGEKPYKCTYCSYASVRSDHLLKHERIHTGEKPYKCAYCSFASAYRQNLLSHESIHTGEKPYKCAYCSYTSVYRFDILKHERIHTGEKPHKCAYCSFASARRQHLLSHESIHTGEKPYKCAHCSYASAQRQHLLSHEIIHSGEKPYKCAHCSYTSARRNDLLKHESIHTGEKPYKCAYCTYASSRRNRLLIHASKHTAEKPYKCDHCNFSSAYKRSLLAHERLHTAPNLTT